MGECGRNTEREVYGCNVERGRGRVVQIGKDNNKKFN